MKKWRLRAVKKSARDPTHSTQKLQSTHASLVFKPVHVLLDSFISSILFPQNWKRKEGGCASCPKSPGIGSIVYTQEIYSLHSVRQRKSECLSCIGCSLSNFNSKKSIYQSGIFWGGIFCFSLYVQQQE